MLVFFHYFYIVFLYAQNARCIYVYGFLHSFVLKSALIDKGIVKYNVQVC